MQLECSCACGGGQDVYTFGGTNNALLLLLRDRKISIFIEKKKVGNNKENACFYTHTFL